MFFDYLSNSALSVPAVLSLSVSTPPRCPSLSVMLLPRFSNPPSPIPAAPDLCYPPFFFPPSSFPVSVTVYCIVGSFTRHLLLSLYSDAMYRTLLQFLYQIFFIFVTFLFLDVAGEAFFISVLFYHLYFWMSSKMFFFFCLFFCFVLFYES